MTAENGMRLAFRCEKAWATLRRARLIGIIFPRCRHLFSVTLTLPCGRDRVDEEG